MLFCSAISRPLGVMNLLSVLLHFSVGHTATIPTPDGPYGVSVNTAKLVDTTRCDPFASDSRKRAIMVSMFYPSGLKKDCETQIVPYMPPATAALQDNFFSAFGIPNGTFGSIQLSLCNQTSQSTKQVEDYPVVIFSPGGGNSRHMYNAMVQSVTSFGFVVLSIDHPYDAEFVEFPDGSIVLAANISSDAQIAQAVDTRAKDVSFVLNEMKKASTVRQFIPSIRTGLKTQRVAMFGHSLGGAAAAAAMMVDSRIIGGANLDGTFFGPVVERGVRNPFLIFAHEGKNQSTDPSWGSIWPHLGKKKLELMLSGAQHGTFTDMPILIDTLGIAEQLPSQVKDLTGTLSGARARDVITAYVVAFLDSVVYGCQVSSLLQGPSKFYPEVSFSAGDFSK